MSNMNALLFEIQNAIDSKSGDRLGKLYRRFLRAVDPNNIEDVRNWDVLIQEIEMNKGKKEAIQAANMVLGLFDDKEMLTERAAHRCQTYFRECMNEDPLRTWYFGVCVLAGSVPNTPLAEVFKTLVHVYEDDAFDVDMMVVSDTAKRFYEFTGYRYEQLRQKGWSVNYNPLNEISVSSRCTKTALLKSQP